MPEPYELKPNKAAFVTYGFLKQLIFSLLVAAIIATVLSAAVSSAAAFILVLAFVLLQVWAYYSLTVRYGKEKYLFFRDRIVRKSGGVFSSKETELVIRNITHVTMKLPYVEHRLFGTGSINIQSAGSGGVEVSLSSVDNPEKFYDYAERLMKTDGFSLTKKHLVQKEKPSVLGVFFEVFKSFLALIIVFIYFLPLGLGAIIYLSSKGSVYTGILIFFAAVMVLLFFLHLLFKFLDFKFRVYEIYSDTITYSEGFLSKNYAFIPMENLSDSEVKQTFVDKVFGLYDVKISCQGAVSEILFKNMRNGTELEANLDKLISNFKPLIGTAKVALSSVAEKHQTQARKQASVNPEYLAEFKMQMFRTLAPMLLMSAVIIIAILIVMVVLVFFINATGVAGLAIGFQIFTFLVPVAIISFVSVIIRVASTRYLVKKESVEERYDFFSSKHKEFTNEKIMAVVFRESFIDKWFKTCSIHFWSIGSAESIKFSNIPKTNQLYDNLLGKIGIKLGAPIYSLGSEFSISDKLKAELFSTVFSLILWLGLLAAGIIFHFAFIIALLFLFLLFVIKVAYQNAYYKRSKLAFYKDFVHFRKGIFFKEFYYAPNGNIKGITTVKYPFSTKGNVTFDVAGEQLVEVKSKNRKSKMIISNHFTISYLPEITTKDDFVDMMFYRKPTSTAMVATIAQYVSKGVQKPLLVSKPAVANTLINSIVLFVFFSIVLTVILFSLRSSFQLIFQFIVLTVLAAEVLLFFFIIILSVIGVKVKSYSIESYRLIAKSGIIYKTQKSILLSEIDHINLIQGMLNKMFNNGTIAVNTTGSSRTEMFIQNIPDFKKFYEELQKRYQANA